MFTKFRIRMSLFLAGALLGWAQASSAVNVSEMPLFISAGVTPNVMLVVDNSGSMNSIVWAAGFDPKNDYPDWSPRIDHDCRTDTGLREAWSADDSSVNYSALVSSNFRGTCSGSTNTAPTCASGFARGRNADGTITKCLKLPDPVGSGNTRYLGNYLNYLFETYAGGTDLSTGTIPNSDRMTVAKNVATSVVEDNANLRLGVTRFNNNQGGTILRACGSTTDNLKSSISGLSASAWTPLGETLYEVTRYFRGLNSFYNTDVAYTSPIQYRCQQNFAIVITDGYPTYDAYFSTTDPADVADPARSLPDWDGLAPATTAAQYPNFPQHSDGFKTGSEGDEGRTLYLDDIAKFAQDIDLRVGGTDLTGVSFDDAAYRKQSLVTYTVGFAVANQMMADAAAYGNGIYYQANDEEQLTLALQSAFKDIDARQATAAAVATNSTRITAGTFVYQAKFSTGDWSGQLLALPIDGDTIGTVGVDGIPRLGSRTGWNAALEMPAAANRAIYTYDPDANAGRAFLWDNLTAAQQAALDKDAGGVTDSLGADRLLYVRGDQSNEGASGHGFRPRTYVLGDIVNSDPAYVGTQDYAYQFLPGDEGTSYKEFRKTDAYRSRDPMLYVAANDGMLHAFDAMTGDERFAYVPAPAIGELSQLTDPDYNSNHRLIHDGSPYTSDARLGDSWQTVLIGTLGGGGKGVYALNVTDPSGFGADDVLWEFTADDDSNLGVSIPQPAVARLESGDWVALVPNGYNSGGNAVLFVLDLETGAILKEINTGVGGDNGLSSPVPIDIDGDRIADYAYAGDLQGNLWKFDLTGSSSNWKVAFTSGGVPAPLYTACSSDPCSADNRQPITGRPRVGINPPEGVYVYFGTGSYFAVGDNTTSGGTQTVYAIRDRNVKDTATAVMPAAGRGGLIEQEVIFEDSAYDFMDEEGLSVENVAGVRVTSANPVADSDDGWFIDLPTAGERQVSPMLLRDDKLIFTTLIPSTDACSAGGSSWIMILDALSGSRLTGTPFDLNEDDQFSRLDFVTITIDGEEVVVPASGTLSSVGILDGVLVHIDRDDKDLTGCGSTGECENLESPLFGDNGRLSWRSIQ